MKRITMILLACASTALAGQGEQPVVLPPSRAASQAPAGAIDNSGSHPFGAIETRPLWERPSAVDVGGAGLTLQQRTEAALDRGNGRVEDQPSFDLRQIERERLGGT